jgi:hypothetical protein
MAEIAVLTVGSKQSLRATLDAINEAGIDPKVPGIDAEGTPFLAMLSGPYAEHVEVALGSPWDPEVDHRTPVRCVECDTHDLSTMEALNFPVVILAADKEDQ